MEKPKGYEQFNERPGFAGDLMTYAEYAKVQHPELYEYQLVTGERSLDFLGVKHTNNPSDSVFEYIREQLDLQKPDLVLIEGVPSINSRSTEEINKNLVSMTDNEVIQKYGEAIFTAKLAAERGIKIVSPEPDEESAVRFIEKQGLSREVIFAHRVAALIAQYNRAQMKPDLENYIAPYLSAMSAQFGWEDFDFSLEHFKSAHEAIFHKVYQPEDVAFYKAACDPVPWEGKAYASTNAVAAKWGEYRDQHMLNELQKALDVYKKLFIVYGSSHAVILEPALKKMMADRT